MKVVFSRSLHIGKNYWPAGECDVPEQELRTPMMAKHIKAGHIMEPSQAPRKPVHKTNQERATALLEKIHGPKANLSVAEAEKQAAASAPADEAQSSGDADQAADESKPQAGKSSKKNR
jgi:hypothetical protein